MRADVARYRRGMVTIGDVAAMATALPGVTEGSTYSNRSWNVGKRHFVWDRPFSKADIKRFGGDPVPAGPIVALRVEDEHEKQAVLASGVSGVFTIPHFDGYPAVLVRLPAISKGAMPRPRARRLARRGARSSRPRAPGSTTRQQTPLGDVVGVWRPVECGARGDQLAGHHRGRFPPVLRRDADRAPPVRIATRRR